MFAVYVEKLTEMLQSRCGLAQWVPLIDWLTVCRTGALRVGDRILAINGVTLRGRNIEEAVRLLPTNDDSINIKVMRHLSPASAAGQCCSMACLCLLCIEFFLPAVVLTILFSGRWWVFLFVCLFLCYRTAIKLMKFCVNVYRNNYKNPIEFQGRRSKVKVTGQCFWIVTLPLRYKSVLLIAVLDRA